ncbi:MAG: cell division protein FtsW [Candidatus Chisholmbacteria bacterium RIFCSPLOWO2_01_FULL_50_28]|uniref:Probable peptidoglycan glycosyltransferase FtsW n=1 Tax=Candidatus Chisholmbacteria bacterium RIFCSPHIGHO2_01_FULL_52_32 TaxID=1797591 RepID=A0A1G1VSQ8_9BACT|nr:MAG: cell division protein FtsW [Candidatus Chisholmbacteria bacterium RIFCSPHIGHO2_01_FULL_52_32]OGY20188.1 MAG: cell division protein FtsW [Candidatus Chisholmbacteria bacterium RIFCSPLOWO2_01_FULL_50_28]
MDYTLFFCAVLLTLFGVLMVYDASVVEAYQQFGNKFFFAKQQLVWAGIGLVVLGLTSQIPYWLWKKVSIGAFVATVVMLGLVLVPSIGMKIQGARRWIGFGSLTIQPAELAKLTLILYLSLLLEKKRSLLQFLVAVGVAAGLIVLEPDLGTGIVIVAIGAALYFFSGAPLKTFLTLGIVGTIVGMGVIAISPYRRARVATFFNPKDDPLGASYHIRQVLIALGSGGLFGVGIGQSRQKFQYIPAATTDSIFAIIAEEVGFIGSLGLIVLFLFMIMRAMKIARQSKDQFGKLLCGGIAAWIGIQAALNLATMVALVPLTGIPLPLISYGGSATIVTLAGIGIVLNVSKYAK